MRTCGGQMDFPVSIPLRKTSSSSEYYYPANPGMYPQGNWAGNRAYKGRGGDRWSFVEFLSMKLKLDFHMLATSASSIFGSYLQLKCEFSP